jgi:hypothetical protein
MQTTSKWPKIAGLVIHLLIGALLLFAGSMILLGAMPEDPKAGPIAVYMPLIGVGEVVTALLLIFPRTASLGILLASAFWGGTISFHMSREEPFVMQSVFLLLTWIGAYLRVPATFSTLTGAAAAPAQAADEPVVGVR